VLFFLAISLFLLAGCELAVISTFLSGDLTISFWQSVS